MKTGNRIEGAMVCTSLGRPLRPLFYFLCSILLIHRVQSWAKKWACFAKQQPGRKRQKTFQRCKPCQRMMDFFLLLRRFHVLNAQQNTALNSKCYPSCTDSYTMFVSYVKVMSLQKMFHLKHFTLRS